MSKAIEMPSTVQPQQTSQELLDETLRERIQQRAYQLFEARGAEPGHALEDWTRAESEILGKTHINRAA